jgi:transposase, IS30 family
MSTYHHFSLAEREEISRALAQGRSLRSIAVRLQRSPSSISREVQRHWTSIGYRACTAAFRARKRSHKARQQRFTLLRPALWEEIKKRLRMRWSPEQISSWLEAQYADPAMHVSHETIYAALYILPRGTLRKELQKCMRLRHKRRRKRGKLLVDRRGQIPDLVSIHDRPLDVEGREIAGHWEGDLLMGGAGKGAIGTLVERKTRYLLLCKLSSVSAEKAWRAFANRFNALPEDLRKSLTYDRGMEMKQHKKFTESTKAKVYFCDPQSPWQRGTNENTNGLLRQFFPKGGDFRTLSARELRNVEELMNGRPRKTLDWCTPDEIFTSHLRVALGT